MWRGYDSSYFILLPSIFMLRERCRSAVAACAVGFAWSAIGTPAVDKEESYKVVEQTENPI